jgi:hypothetical protein
MDELPPACIQNTNPFRTTGEGYTEPVTLQLTYYRERLPTKAILQTSSSHKDNSSELTSFTMDAFLEALR